MIKTLFETALIDVKKTDVEGVGVLRYEAEGKIFRWVKNRSTTTAIVAKQPVCYNEGNTGTIAIYQSVNEPESGNIMLAAGLAVTALVASATNALCYGWVQVQGYFQDAIVDSNTAIYIGDELIITNDGEHLVLSASTVGNAPIYSSHFIALEDVVSGSSDVAADVLIKCL